MRFARFALPAALALIGWVGLAPALPAGASYTFSAAYTGWDPVGFGTIPADPTNPDGFIDSSIAYTLSNTTSMDMRVKDQVEPHIGVYYAFLGPTVVIHTPAGDTNYNPILSSGFFCDSLINATLPPNTFAFYIDVSPLLVTDNAVPVPNYRPASFPCGGVPTIATAGSATFTLY